MKQIKTISIFLSLLSIFISCQDSKKSSLTLISNQIPTDKALIFGEGVISTDDFEFAITFNPKMNELFFTRRKPEKSNEIYSMKLTGGKWSAPKLAFFSADNVMDFEPHINPQGNRLYWGSTRPLINHNKSSGLRQWYSEKNANGWEKPIPLEEPFVERACNNVFNILKEWKFILYHWRKR